MEKEKLQIISEALSLPLYLYQGKKLLFAWPEQAKRYAPPTVYLMRALEEDFKIPFVTTSYQSVFGQLPVEMEEGQFIMVGPVAQLLYGEDEYRRIFSEYRVVSDERDGCIAFFQGIPCMLVEQFGNILRMLHHFLGNCTALDFRFFKNLIPTAALHSRAVEGLYESGYLSQVNESLVYEKILTDIVERGQLDKIDEITTAFFDFCKGVLAENPLRSMKNLIISGITLFTRAAIRGGVPSQLAFQISDLHIMNLEKCNNADAASEQFMQSLVAFTGEVRKVKEHMEQDSCFEGIIRYVREHTDMPLTVAHIAAEFGYNSNYLSGAFKKELGFPLSAYILRCKLEEARELLQFTSRSILEISEHLCFSSQNYFQTVFRRQYGVTPLQYRKRERKNRV